MGCLGSEVSDSEYIGNLSLDLLGLQRAPVEEEESDDVTVDDSSDEDADDSEEAAE